MEPWPNNGWPEPGARPLRRSLSSVARRDTSPPPQTRDVACTWRASLDRALHGSARLHGPGSRSSRRLALDASTPQRKWMTRPGLSQYRDTVYYLTFIRRSFAAGTDGSSSSRSHGSFSGRGRSSPLLTVTVTTIMREQRLRILYWPG